MRSKLLRATLAFAGLALALAGATAAAAAESPPRYTSVKPADCRAPIPALARHYKARDLGVQACGGFGGYTLLVASSDERSWVDLALGRVVLSTEKVVTGRSDFGHFPNVGPGKVEWHSLPDGGVAGLIFRVTAQDPENTNKSRSRLFVIRLQGNQGHFCGLRSTNEEARALMRSPQACTEALDSATLP